MLIIAFIHAEAYIYHMGSETTKDYMCVICEIIVPSDEHYRR